MTTIGRLEITRGIRETIHLACIFGQGLPKIWVFEVYKCLGEGDSGHSASRSCSMEVMFSAKISVSQYRYIKSLFRGSNVFVKDIVISIQVHKSTQHLVSLIEDILSAPDQRFHTFKLDEILLKSHFESSLY